MQGRREGRGLEAFLPRVAETDSSRRSLHCRAAVAATFVAGLELARDGTLALDQDAPWQPIQVHRRHDNSPDSAADPTTEERVPSPA